MANSQTACAKKSDLLVVGGNALNKIKWLLSIILLAGAIVGFQYFAAFPMPARVAGLVVSVLVALGVACTTAQGRSALEFINSAKAEARKVVWPTKAETIQSTMVVVVMVLVASIFLWLLDSLLLYVMTLVTA